jgi:hypothetical protein
MLNSLQLSPSLPACACAAVAGLPAPAPLGISHLVCRDTPEVPLVGPAGFAPAPDLVTPTYVIPAQRLCGFLQAVAADHCLTHTAARCDDQLQTHWAVCKRALDFSDRLAARIMPNGPDDATLVPYCRSVYGHSDPGVSLARLRTWLGALNASLPMSTER